MCMGQHAWLGVPNCYSVIAHLAVIELDLTAPHFKPGKPNYERVKWCLSGRLGMEADFVISWTCHGKASVVHSLIYCTINTSQC